MKDTILIRKGHFSPLAVIIMIALPIVIGIVCMCVGRMRVPFEDVINSLTALVTGQKGNVQNYSIIVKLRLPRILVAIPALATHSSHYSLIHWQHRIFLV